jgi:hypothetical protein
MKVIDANTFVNSFKIKPDKSLSFLLGAGASVSSNIPSGGQMVWDFKRTLYCTDNNIRTSLYGDLSKENVQKEIQSYFDGRGGYPELWSPEEYSFYFEKCYPSRSDREYYIRNKVRDIKPSLGYLCMGELIVNGKIDLVSTTNFDDLVQAGVHSINPGFSIKTISSAVSNSVGFALNEGFPNIIKLHGDYLFDKLKNTESELQKLEDKIADIWKTSIKQNGLIVIGYAGNDNSVMSVLEELINEGGIKKGVYWCKPRGSKLSIRACKFMENACNVNEQSAVVEIDGFDDLMYSLYLAMNLENTNIYELWKGHDKKQEILYDAIGRHTASAITNALPAIQFPRKCYAFSSNITTWKELRAITNNSCVAILHKGKVWALGSKNGILEAFADKNISDIEEMDIPIYMMKLEHSDVIGMFYEIIENNLLSKGLSSFGKNKYFDINSRRLRNGYFVYDAIKIALSFVEDNVVMKLLPTVHVLKSDGSQLDRFAYQNIVNNEMSTLYNKQMNEKVEIWVQKLSTNRKLIFELGNAIVEFSTQRIRFAGTGSIDKCYQAKETELAFDYENDSCIAVNQLKGLINYGPLESYANRSVRLAVLSPRECAADIWRHLNELNKHHATTLKQDKAFLPEYIGFQDVFRCGLDIPNGDDTKRFMGYSLSEALKTSAQEFFNGICRYIDVMEREKHEFDVLVIYIPNRLSKMRELKNENVYFDLHDSLKIYCAGKGIVTQIIEERSVHTNSDMAKIMWGLSTAIYTKAVGKLWKPKMTRYDTAYIGLSYVQSIKNNEKISIGCSQLFDSEGNGMELYLRPLKDPQIIQKNPYMRSGDACRLMNNLKRIYDESVPLHKLNRIVIHKTTHFTKEEMEGITKGLAGVDNIELLQIQEFSAWRAIRFQNDVATPFPIQRGTVIPLDKDTFLIWTHGSVQHDELAGKNLNYYKNGRGIPAPLLVKRFMGKSSALELVNEILMLTKMNWNSGDGLYKILPVTLDFAKTLSRVAKQDLVVYDRPYDFRYFM